jgi:hypothetical protein
MLQSEEKTVSNSTPQHEQNTQKKSVIEYLDMHYLELIESSLSEWNSENDNEDFAQLGQGQAIPPRKSVRHKCPRKSKNF